MLIQLIILIVLTLIIGTILWKLKLVTTEIALAIGVVTVLLALTVVAAGWTLIKADKLSFNEYWNGYEKTADHRIDFCHRDGSCNWNYNCDPYTVTETKSRTDSEGNTEYYTETHTEWHSCPYVTEEWIFTIDTTLGEYRIARTFATNPVEFRAGNGIPDVFRGIPPFWQAAKDRINAGKPGPVTKRMQYDNYLLASDKTILNQYSDQIDVLKERGLLPSPESKVQDFYNARKVYFVGYTPDSDKSWQEALSYLNSGLGTELQGDLHLVITEDSRINPNSYVLALKAYWSDPAVFGDDSISKNSIIVAVGIADNHVQWARAITGMPLGNESMLHAIQDELVGVLVSPETLIGTMSSEFYTNDEGKLKVRPIHSDGALDRILWGLDNAATKFQRVSMSGGDEEDNGSGFGYLEEEIQPSDGQQLFILILGAIFITIAWAIGTWIFVEEQKSRRRYY